MPSPKPQSTRPDTKAVLVSVLAALIFWWMNALNKDGYQLQVSYPIQIQFDDSLYIPVEPLPQQVAINVTGNGWDLLRKQLAIDTRPLVYAIRKPLRTRFVSNNTLTVIANEQIQDVKVNTVLADTLLFSFEKKIKKRLHIQIDSAHIPLANRYVVSSPINVSPRQVLIEGPASFMRKYPDTLWVKIPGKRLRENFDDKVLLPLEANPLIKVSHEKLSVNFEVDMLVQQ
jgi:hypothetical protein